MCGIFALLNTDGISQEIIQTQFEKGKNRGPEYSKLKIFENLQLGFHRLAINGLNDKSNQPLTFNNINFIFFVLLSLLLSPIIISISSILV